LYPLLLSDKYGYTAGRITVVSVTSNLGALVGGTSAGYISQVVGRRFVMVVVLFIGGALLYPYTHVSNNGIFAAVFFEQFCIQGALGIVPIHLVELAPADYRVFIVGFAYHLGILVSSPVDTIEARIGEHFPLPSTTNGGSSTSGAPRFDYGQVMAIFIGCAYLYSIIITAVGPERRGGNLRRDVDEIDNIDYEGAEDGSGSQKRSIDLVGV
jgi:SHS family lactate transporter-like MFS transporter